MKPGKDHCQANGLRCERARERGREAECARDEKKSRCQEMQREIKDGERVLQTPGQLAAVMNIRAAV